jgi:signal transduction histidine kinase
MKAHSPLTDALKPAGAPPSGETPHGTDRAASQSGSGAGPRRILFWTGSAVLLIMAGVTPITASLYDASVRALGFWSVLGQREVANVIGAACGIAVLYLMSRARRVDTSNPRWIVIIALLASLATTAARQIAQLTFDPSGTRPQLPGQRGAEASIALLVFLLLTGALLLVAQRDRLANAQTVLLDEARRALHDDHESLRARIFDHLHGTVQSELVVARVRLLDIARELPEGEQAEGVLQVADGLQRLHELEVRRLAHVMVASGLDTSLHEALSQLAMSCEGLCDVRIRIDAEFEAIDDARAGDGRAVLRLAIFRIVEECITNAIRHGHASAIDVEIAARASGRKRLIDVVVSNNGVTDGVQRREGVGLRVLRARAAAFNGGVETYVADGRYRTAVRLELRD